MMFQNTTILIITRLLFWAVLPLLNNKITVVTTAAKSIAKSANNTRPFRGYDPYRTPSIDTVFYSIFLYLLRAHSAFLKNMLYHHRQRQKRGTG